MSLNQKRQSSKSSTLTISKFEMGDHEQDGTRIIFYGAMMAIQNYVFSVLYFISKYLVPNILDIKLIGVIIIKYIKDKIIGEIILDKKFPNLSHK